MFDSLRRLAQHLPMKKYLVITLFALLTELSLSGHAHAQGLSEPSSLGLAPPSSVATSDEASAVMINPAGIGFVGGPELLYLHSSQYGAQRSDVDSLFGAVTLFDTLGLGFGAEFARPWATQGATAGQPFVRGSLSYALRLDETISLGGSWRVLSAQAPNLAAAQMYDFGLQLRPLRSLSLGFVIENAIPHETTAGPLTPRAYRLGFGLRPGAEWATLAVETRIDEALRIDPALLLKIEPLDGIILSGQVVARDVVNGFNDLTLGLGLEINHAAIGLGGSAASSPAMQLSGFTTYARLSAAAYPSMLPRIKRSLLVKLAGDLQPVPPDNPIEAAAYSSEDGPGELALALDRATFDDTIKAVVLDIRPLSAGFASIQEMRARIIALRDQGKKVIAYAERLGNREYFLASAADRIVVPPSASLMVNGLGMTSYYFADTLAFFGVTAQAVHAGEYKSAPETFTRNAPSPEAQESNGRLADVLFAEMVQGISQGRSLPEDKVRALIDQGLLNANQAQKAGLVDQLAYAEELEKIVEKTIGGPTFLDEDFLHPLRHKRHWASLPSIALIPIDETITMGKSSGGFLGRQSSSGAEDIVGAINAAAKDDDVKAIVLRVNSPGGDALASDLIWRAVSRARSHKPVVASFADVAASGGYYVACGADEIFAEPSTITGSIGVFALFFTGGELLQKFRIGVHEDQRGELGNIFSSSRPPNAAEIKALEKSIDGTYTLFKQRVSQGRKLSMDQVQEIARGRVWSGRDAQSKGLVDSLGGLSEALAAARARAKLDPDKPIDVSLYRNGLGPNGRWEQRSKALAQVAEQQLVSPQMQALSQIFGRATMPLSIAAQGRPLAMMPYTIELR